MSKRIVIIGAGLAGVIAYNALRSYKPIILEAGPERDRMQVHPAVMRLRDPAVAQFIGAKYEKIIVQKAIYYNGRTYNQSNIFFNNLYSLKLYRELGRRSLEDLGSSVRYILPEGYPAPEKIEWGATVKLADKGHIMYSSRYEAGDKHIYYDYCISTLPMPKMVNEICQPNIQPHHLPTFKAFPVHVMHLLLPFKSTIHQTIYFPNPETQIYRITISGQRVIVEGMDEFQSGEAADLISYAFGIDNVLTRDNETFKLPIGKMMAINDDVRRNYIIWLTSEHKVFSFGRFSVWRPLRTDQLLGDIEKIKRWISATDTENKYRNKLMEDSQSDYFKE